MLPLEWLRTQCDHPAQGPTVDEQKQQHQRGDDQPASAGTRLQLHWGFSTWIAAVSHDNSHADVPQKHAASLEPVGGHHALRSEQQSKGVKDDEMQYRNRSTAVKGGERR